MTHFVSETVHHFFLCVPHSTIKNAKVSYHCMFLFNTTAYYIIHWLFNDTSGKIFFDFSTKRFPSSTRMNFKMSSFSSRANILRRSWGRNGLLWKKWSEILSRRIFWSGTAAFLWLSLKSFTSKTRSDNMIAITNKNDIPKFLSSLIPRTWLQTTV